MSTSLQTEEEEAIILNEEDMEDEIEEMETEEDEQVQEEEENGHESCSEEQETKPKTKRKRARVRVDKATCKSLLFLPQVYAHSVKYHQSRPKCHVEIHTPCQCRNQVLSG